MPAVLGRWAQIAMDQSPDDLPLEDQDPDDDLEILDRILKEEQSRWDESGDASSELAGDDDDSFYIFEEEEAGQVSVPEEAIRIANRFLLVEELSSGERGTLYEVRDGAHDERPCRLRVLSPAWLGAAPVEDLLVRAESVRSSSRELEHVSAIPFDECGQSDEGSFWLSTAEPEGESLAQLMQRSGALPPAHALEIICQLLSGLEHAEAQGLRHGALDAQVITLAPQVGWSEENPFAVGVRISELGLSSLAPTGREAEEDLFVCAQLLAQLLTGEAFDPSASSWASSAAASKSLGLSEPLGVLLDTGLAEDPGDRYPSATAFRSALERVEEYRPKPAGSRRSLVTNLLLLAAISAVLYGTKERWWPAADSQAQDTSALEARQAELDAQRAENQRLLDEEKARAEAAAQKLADSLAAQEQQKTLSEEELAELEANLEAERLAREAALEAERLKSGEVDSLTQDLENSKARIQELETAAQRRDRLAKESIDAEALALASADIERLLRALEAGNLVNARQINTELGANELVLAAPISLLPFFDGLLSAHDALALLDADEDPFKRAGGLESSAQAMAQARARAQPVMTGDNDSELLDDSQRIAAYEAHLTSMETRLQEHRDNLSAEFADLWAATLATPDQEPELVLRRAAAVGDVDAGRQEFIQSYVAFLRRHALAYDSLDLSKLKAIRSLDDWRDQLLAQPSPSLSAESDLLETLVFARDFYSGTALPAAPASLFDAGSDEGWLERLSLSAALLDKARGMRAEIGTRLLYHTRTDSGEETWRWDTVLVDLNPPKGVDDSRLIQQEFHDKDGNKLGQRTVRLYRIGLRLYEGDARPVKLIDLAIDGPPYSIHPWRASDELLPPPKLRVAPGAFTAFRDRLATENWRTLHVEDGRQLTLWARELGIVRLSIPGRITHDLVYAEFP